MNGFQFGPMTISRVCSNDGKDKRKKFWVVSINTPQGLWWITADVKGNLEIKNNKDGAP